MASDVMAAPDHPHQDPGDGRTECQACGKYIWPAIHSCKGVPVTAKAKARRAAVAADEYPDGTRIEFESHTDVYGAWRDDQSSRTAGYTDGENWCVYGETVPLTWTQMCERFGISAMATAVRLRLDPDDADSYARWPAAAHDRDRAAVVEQFTAALLTGLDDLECDDHWGTLVRPGDVADLVHRVAAEVGR